MQNPGTVTINIDGESFAVDENQTLLQAALENGKYIPHLCSRKGLVSSRCLSPTETVYLNGKVVRGDSESFYKGCGLCLVEIEGFDGPRHACTALVEEGMTVYLDTDAVIKQRGFHLEDLLEKHPHACIDCDLADGCDRQICSLGIPEPERCCWKYHHCEFREVVSQIGFKRGLSHRPPAVIPGDGNSLMILDRNLCVACLRCVVACREIAEQGVLSFVQSRGEITVGLTHADFKESGCKICLVCLEVCPTGALKEKKPGGKKSKARMRIPKPFLPPVTDDIQALNQPNLAVVPNKPGVYTIYDENRHIIQITGTDDLKKSLQDHVTDRSPVPFFSLEQDEMFLMRETQLIQKFIHKHGDMPENNREMDDLF